MIDSAAGYIFIVFSYLLGSITFGVIIAKYSGLGDLTAQGSGNIGATNVARVGGKKLGALTLFLDALKGLLPVLAAKYWISYEVALLSGLAVVLGHIFPIFLKFKGGKGVATSLAVLWAAYWPAGLFACAIWLLVFFTTRISSLSAIIAFTLVPLFSFLLASVEFTIIAFLLAALIVARHKGNILRLLKGEEGKIIK